MLRKYPCDVIVPIEREPRHRLVLANDFARFFVVEIASHDHTLCHRHEHDYLMYVVGDAQIVSAPRDREPTTLTYHDGDCELSPAGLVHVVQNLRDTSFRNLLVELLPVVRGLRRGPGPKVSSGDVNITQPFEGAHISAFLLRVAVGSQAEISGPAIVASPYEHEVELRAAKEARALTGFCDLFWVGPSEVATLRNHGDTMVKIVSIALGQTGEGLIKSIDRPSAAKAGLIMQPPRTV